MSDAVITGEEMYSWVRELFPVCRSLTGEGTRKTLEYFAALIPGFYMVETPSGTKVFDWEVPNEWNIREAWIEDESGHRLVDFKVNNLHVVGYSEPVDRLVTLEELETHLHSLPEQPEAIPYVTSYYERTWGFCLTHTQRSSLGSGPFKVFIDSTLEEGSLTYGEVFLPGDCEEEVLLSTYVCHPSMANNELSGPAVTAALARLLASRDRRLSYRFLFLPETIGPLVYLSKHRDHLVNKVIAGWVVTCVGDERAVSYLPSRKGNSLADRVSLLVLENLAPSFKSYSFLERGSDERQWCAPFVDLPVCSIMRSKYGTFPEYHSSLDDLSLVSANGLAGSFELLRSCIELLEKNEKWATTVIGEPQLGRRGLYPTLSTRSSGLQNRLLLDLLAYCDGSNDVVDLCRFVGRPLNETLDALDVLWRHELIKPN